MHSNGRATYQRPQLTSQQIAATIPSPAPQHMVTRPDTLPAERLHINYFEEDFLDAYFARNATPTYIHNMMDMGFGRAQINLALDRYTCFEPPVLHKVWNFLCLAFQVRIFDPFRGGNAKTFFSN